jgi:two-component system, sensor histidine kinase PdtaS
VYRNEDSADACVLAKAVIRKLYISFGFWARCANASGRSAASPLVLFVPCSRDEGYITLLACIIKFSPELITYNPRQSKFHLAKWAIRNEAEWLSRVAARGGKFPKLPAPTIYDGHREQLMRSMVGVPLAGTLDSGRGAVATGLGKNILLTGVNGSTTIRKMSRAWTGCGAGSFTSAVKACITRARQCGFAHCKQKRSLCEGKVRKETRHFLPFLTENERWMVMSQILMKQSFANSQVERVLAEHTTRLRACLQRVSGDSYGPEEGSDAWLLLNALIGDAGAGDGWRESSGGPSAAAEEYTVPILITRFEQSGRALAEHGGKLEARLQGLQSYIDALLCEYTNIFREQPHLLAEAIACLHQIQSACVQGLTRGYQAVMDQVSLGLQHVEQHLSTRLKALQRINSFSNSTMDLDQTLESTAKIVADELHADLCSIFFYDELQRILTLRATNGPHPLGGIHFTLRLGEGYSGWVADKGNPLLVRDALADQHFSIEARTYTPEYHGLMSLPIIYFGNVERLIGVINVQSAESRDFTGEEMNFVEVVAGIIAINSENGRLYEQTDEQLRRKVHELATLHRVSSIIASTLNLDEVLQIITTQAVHLSGAERSCIFELDAEKQQLHVVAHYGMNGVDVRRIHIPVSQCCAGRTVETGRPSMAVDCFHKDEHCFIRNDPLISSEIHSILCVPLAVKKKVLGCICIYSGHRHLLSPEQMQLVVTFANEAAIAIENARLYEETRRGLELKSVLLRELHHRVKNNLATVGGILSLQRRRTKSPEVRRTLAESVNRVQGLAATHDLLSHEDVSEARVDDIARKIVGVANANLRPPETQITFVVEPCPIVIPSRAVAILALVLNEMVSNAIKHGMVGMKEGTVTIRGHEEEGMVVVEVIDTGKGPLQPLEEESSEGLGLSLIRNLIGDLGGQFELRRAVSDTDTDVCTVAEVRFPLARRVGPPTRNTRPETGQPL